MLIIRLIIMLEVSKTKQGLELVACRDQKFWKFVYRLGLVILNVENKSYMSNKCLWYLSGVGGWVGGSYSDIKTNLSQVGLDWDWPTGLSLAKIHCVN